MNVPAPNGLLTKPGGVITTLLPLPWSKTCPCLSRHLLHTYLPELNRRVIGWNLEATGDEMKWANSHQLLSSWWLLAPRLPTSIVITYFPNPLFGWYKSLCPQLLMAVHFGTNSPFTSLCDFTDSSSASLHLHNEKRPELQVQVLKDLWPNIHLHLCDKTPKYLAR